MAAKAKKLNPIIQVLMNRDNMTKDEATAHYEGVKEMIDEAMEFGDYGEVEDIMYSELGLEMDYIFDII